MAPYITGTAEHGPRIRPSARSNDFRHEATHDLHSLDHQHYSQIRDKSIMRTIGGNIGSASCFMAPGDLIVIFDGAKTPFILRKEMDEHGEHTKRYMLISDCYLHGWMYGEFFRSHYSGRRSGHTSKPRQSITWSAFKLAQ